MAASYVDHITLVAAIPSFVSVCRYSQNLVNLPFKIKQWCRIDTEHVSFFSPHSSVKKTKGSIGHHQ